VTKPLVAVVVVEAFAAIAAFAAFAACSTTSGSVPGTQRPAPTGSVVTPALSDALLQAAAESSLGNLPGTLIVVQPATGQIRALVDNGDPQAGLAKLSRTPLPPGSTFKLVTAAAALEAKVAGPSSVLSCPGRILVGGTVIANFHDEDLGRLSLTEAFAQSCNTAFASLGVTVGWARLTEMAGALGLTSAGPDNVPPGSVQQGGSLEQLAQLGYGGAGVLVTPVGLAQALSTVVDGGRFIPLTPTLSRTTSEPQTILRPTVAAQLTKMLHAVVAGGTGSEAKVSGLDVAGKTGTVERNQVQGGGNDAWFIAHAVGRGIDLVIVCYLPRGGIGGAAAAPLVRLFLNNVVGRPN
jgi:cell division protein FtsI/penicillin-binding protein 2